MTRYVCTVAAGFVLALFSSSVATAGWLPPVGETQLGTQSIGFGDQTVGEQTNDADVTQEQGNGNVNIAPAISVFGDAETKNAQGNDNTAAAVVDQSNSATQSQTADQQQSFQSDGAGGSCCASSDPEGEQQVYGGDQTIDKQKNDATVEQEQGNGNINVAPAISVFGDASTWNSQGNDNTAVAVVKQSNEATQKQSASQSQNFAESGGSCCGGQSQTGEQKTSFGDQTIDKQKNDASVEQEQGNGNINVAPAISVFGDASTWNSQGNDNTAVAVVKQSNEATQTQSAWQQQEFSSQGGCCSHPQDCKATWSCKPKDDGYSKDGYSQKKRCCDGQSQTGEQKAYFGDQTAGEQQNNASVGQYQGNENVNYAPAYGFPKHKGDSCSKEGYGKCNAGPYEPLHQGGASTWNAQGNGNTAVAWVGQSNEATQSQSAWQSQSFVQDCCKEVIR